MSIGSSATGSALQLPPPVQAHEPSCVALEVGSVTFNFQGSRENFAVEFGHIRGLIQNEQHLV